MRRGDGGARTGARKRMEEEGMGLGFQIRAGAIHNIRSSGRSHPRRPLLQIGISHHTTLSCTQALPNTPDPAPSPRQPGHLAPGVSPPLGNAVLPRYALPRPPPRSSSRCAHSARRRVAPRRCAHFTSSHSNLLPAAGCFICPGRRGRSRAQ